MGTKVSEEVKPIIEGYEEKFTPTICLAEIYAKVLRVEGREKAEKIRVFSKERSTLVLLDEKVAIELAKINCEMKKMIGGWGLADSIVYATGLMKKAKIVTGDEHFRNLENVIFIK